MSAVRTPSEPNSAPGNTTQSLSHTLPVLSSFHAFRTLQDPFLPQPRTSRSNQERSRRGHGTARQPPPSTGPPGTHARGPPLSSGEGATSSEPGACALSPAPPLGSSRAALGYFRLFVLNSRPSLLILNTSPTRRFLFFIFLIFIYFSFSARGRGRGAGIPLLPSPPYPASPPLLSPSLSPRRTGRAGRRRLAKRRTPPAARDRAPPRTRTRRRPPPRQVSGAGACSVPGAGGGLRVGFVRPAAGWEGARERPRCLCVRGGCASTSCAPSGGEVGGGGCGACVWLYWNCVLRSPRSSSRGLGTRR